MRRDVACVCVCTFGVVVAVVAVRKMRSLQNRMDEKPQRKFKKILADNSQAPFAHLLPHPNKAFEEIHPFGEEIRTLSENPAFQFSDREPSLEMNDPPIWINTVEQLQSLEQVLSKQTEFAVDTEQHNTRSFLGFTALIQISTYEHDYLVDAIALHDYMDILRPVFANPWICKVFHGADSDILWLQRDFHIYVVNLFDTARACDVLGKPQRSLAYLLQTYCSISANKTFQKADWRQRPLPEDMLLYARTDAHFLLYIARQLYAELLQGDANIHNPPLLELCMRRSQLICLQLYEKEGIGSSPASAAASLISKYHHPLQDQSQEASFRWRVRLLCEWRDTIARNEDDSLRYVLSDAALVAIAKACPATAKEVHSIIKATDDASSNAESLPSASPLITTHMNSLILALTESNTADITTQHEPEVHNNKKIRSLGVVRPRKNAELKRMQFVKKFSCKGLVYENCRIYAGDGRLLCYCDRKKLDWYLQRGLAEDLNEDPAAIRLRFEPKGRPEDENNEFYIQSKSNQCVGCGESTHYLRYRIIPSCYRQHFPEYLKSHRSHDIVLLCVDCHEKAHRAAEKYKHVISAEYGIPLFARKIVETEEEGESAVLEGEVGVPPLQLRNAAMALLCHGHELPESRREELEMVISTYFVGRQVTEEDMKTAALMGVDPRTQKKLSRKIEKVLSKRKKQQTTHTNRSIEAERNTQRVSTEVTKTSKGSKISLLGHGLHGKKVVEMLWREHGEQGIREFIQRWRLVFVDAVRPAFLPSGWDVTHSGHREFGEHSVYRPKWMTRT